MDQILLLEAVERYLQGRNERRREAGIRGYA